MHSRQLQKDLDLLTSTTHLTSSCNQVPLDVRDRIVFE